MRPKRLPERPRLAALTSNAAAEPRNRVVMHFRVIESD